MQSPVGKSVVRILLSEGSNPELRQLSGMAYQEAGSRGPWKTLASATARGEFQRDIDPSLLLFTTAGALMHRVFVEQQAATDAYVRQVVDLVLSGAKNKCYEIYSKLININACQRPKKLINQPSK